MSNYSYRFSGIERLYGAGSLDKLQAAHICIVGIGGVGTWVAESIARSGVGEISLIDMDEICSSNTNRQLHALTTTVGKSKVQEMKNRIELINPDCKVHAIEDFLTQDSLECLITPQFTWVIDAIDSLSNKCLLINYCKTNNINIITLGAAGGKKDLSKLKLDDLSKTRNDKLLQKVKKQLRQKYNFPRADKKFLVPCIYSEEMASLPELSCDIENSSLKLDCSSGFGTATHITGSFGFFASAFVIQKITES